MCVCVCVCVCVCACVRACVRACVCVRWYSSVFGFLSQNTMDNIFQQVTEVTHINRFIGGVILHYYRAAFKVKITSDLE